MKHGPATEWKEDKAAGYKTRLGLRMFFLYCIVYAGFVVINSIWPELMAKKIGSVNLAIAYGFGLIIFALILAVVYNTLCGRKEEEVSGEGSFPELEEVDPEDED